MVRNVTDSIDDSRIESVVQEIDRLITEMTALRSQLVFLSHKSADQTRSVRTANYFGMWADRQDMRGLSSREWLENLRAKQWTRQ
ncbi:MAG: hypothetical protein HZB51_19225 [Chloroflexi bacterium]|nr:hypothetical protein [Chloroflexota bacterium]